MKFFQGIFWFLIYSNLFIAACAVVMVYQTYQLVLHSAPNNYFVAFVFFSTICSYSFHWYLTPADISPTSPRSRWLQINKSVHLLLLVVGMAGVFVTLFFLWPYWHWLLVAAVVTFFYSAPKIPHPYFRALRKVALAKTIFLAFVWMYVTTVLPLQLSDQSWRSEFTLFAVSRFFLLYAICILFDYRDRDHDKSIGIRSLITWLNESGINRLFSFSLVLFVVFSCWLTIHYNYGFLTAMFLLLPGMLTALLYPYAKRNFSDVLYYFVLDGLMALSSLLTLVFARNI